jgi:hypothetical protein
MRVSVSTVVLFLAFTIGPFATAAEWQTLFDGQSLAGWKSYKSDKIGDAWSVVDGTLHLSQGGGGDIMTEQTYTDFELKFEWKISEGGNSGVMYRVRPDDKAPYMSGPEYQVLDDSRHRDGKNPDTSAGALYAMIAPKGKQLNPPGEWNTATIKLHNGQLEHWLNGIKVVETTVGNAQWDKLVQESKFRQWPQFGRSMSGHICLQDHGDKVWFRNIRIRELD